MKKIIPRKVFCQKCGSEMRRILLPNETPYSFVFGPYCDSTIEISGHAFDKSTGKKLYRERYECPTLEKKWPWSKKESHLKILGKTDLFE